jgi:prepilin-type processing-associated H-X9-DG protein
MSTYLAENNAILPPSYVYPDKKDGWNTRSQRPNHPWGYLHWSHFLYDNGKVNPKAFECPNYPNGGAPRTNPGSHEEDWEGGQGDQNQNELPNELEDRQAPRMAYAANAAVVPRNKFTNRLSDGLRVNVLVQENKITRPSDTILATEYVKNWKALGIQQGGGLILSKSHRPINVFYHAASGFNEYKADPQSSSFYYGTKLQPRTPQDYGLMKLSEVKSRVNILDYTSNTPQINAVGRHHPGGDRTYGGTANFLFCDNHTERMTVLESVVQRKWGDRYYSLSGANKVMNYLPVH